MFAHDPKAHRRWVGRRKRTKGQSVGLTGASLEAAVMGLAMSHPEYVVVGA